MVTHTREPVVNCRTKTGKTLNAKHQKTSGGKSLTGAVSGGNRLTGNEKTVDRNIEKTVFDKIISILVSESDATSKIVLTDFLYLCPNIPFDFAFEHLKTDDAEYLRTIQEDLLIKVSLL